MLVEIPVKRKDIFGINCLYKSLHEFGFPESTEVVGASSTYTCKKAELLTALAMDRLIGVENITMIVNLIKSRMI